MTVTDKLLSLHEPTPIRRGGGCPHPSIQGRNEAAGGEARRVDSMEQYLERLASDAPTPGGGSAAAVVAGLGAALVAMVARITRLSPRFAERHATADELADRADALRADLLSLRAADEAAYGSVVAAMALPRGTEEERAARTAALQIALAEAAAEPLAIAQRASEVLTLASRALDLDNQNLNSDVLCAGEFASAALAAAAANVRINHRYLKNTALIASQSKMLADIEDGAPRLLARIRETVNAPI